MKFSIIVPAHNEQENIEETINSIERRLKLDYELIVVNDNSVDQTPEIVRKLSYLYPNLKIVNNPNPPGFANAIRAGFANVATDLVVPVMGDLCDDLDTIKLMLNKIEQGYDVVCGCRYIRGGARLGGSKFKGFLSAAAGWTIHFILGVPTHDIANAFKMYRMEAIRSMEIKATGFDISMEIPLKAYFNKFKITEVPTIWKERSKGKSNFKVFKLLPNYLKLYFLAILKRRLN